MQPSLQDAATRIDSALEFIHAHPDADLSLEAMASRAHWSPFHFHRVFRALVGVPLHQYVRESRLERGRELLAREGAQVSRVAPAVGYASPDGFSRALRSERAGGERARARAGGESPPGRCPPAHRLEVLPDRHIAFVRYEGRPEGIGLAWWRLMSRAGRRGLLRTKPESFGMLHSDPDAASPPRVCYDACLVVAPGAELPEPVRSGRLPSREWFVALHEGPMRAVGATIDWCIAEGIPRSGRALADGPCLVKVLNWSLWTPQSRWRSEVFLAVSPPEHPEQTLEVP